ncbi:MAG: Chemotaxis protein CheW [Candidatus Daviesbacteria bacterium GW2011_GWA2_40_9]|uniref:Chemotaxis protein CheW n=1 Tax=Candidatus Daviesbacteria bacterium GW2011_GWA2_40_9 TaxID=1618424 RepID=A0A0G0U8B1_9BACT|nr:MAG: Chemotaxis protein CheW [Candidatus Daviesbacteria bacterium GW2011_GWA2_40_9]
MDALMPSNTFSGSGKTREAAEGLLQLVTFKLDDEEFAINILEVQEINRMTSITKMPNSPHHVEGVVNLRGRVIPVVSLRKKLGLAVKENNEHSRIMIMDIQGTTMGLIVDAVSEVLRIPSGIVEPPPPLSTDSGTEYIKGVAKLEDRLIMLVDLKGLFGMGDVSLIES